MYSIAEMDKVLPYYYEDKVLKMIGTEDIEKYSKIIRSKYFNEFADNSFENYSHAQIKNGLLVLINEYSTLQQTNNELRLVLKDVESNKIIGGCTLREIKLETYSNVELAYFVCEEYRNHGECTKMISNVIKMLIESNIKIYVVKLLIREYNYASIEVAKKLCFKEVREIQGKECKNILFERVICKDI